MPNEMNRRQFIGLGTMAVAGAALMSCAKPKPSESLNLPLAGDLAPDGPELRAGLVGCGGRGTGAAIDFLSAGPNLRVTALGDVFRDRLEDCRGKLKKEKNTEIPEENCFVGFDAFQKVIDSGVEVVILATPPHFRPEHFAAAVDARKHVFMEKPVAVDPVGVRSVIAASKRAEAMGLCVATGTQRRHQRDYVETYKHVVDGAIGEIVAANCYWNQDQLWYRTREKEWTDMEYMIRDWVNWCWLSGDHIVEQHVHNIDIINWFTGSHPVKAVGVGSRLHRPTGDQYDFFSVDFVFENAMHLHSLCRQINGCSTHIAEHVVGTKGYTNCRNTIYNLDGTIKWTYTYPLDESGKPMDKVKISPYVQEHIDMVTAIRTNKPFVEAENTAISTMTAVMGRISAYTGKEVTWEEMMSSDLRLGPKEYIMSSLDIKAEIPIAGTT
jgi:predicted dehydrogenase